MEVTENTRKNQDLKLVKSLNRRFKCHRVAYVNISPPDNNTSLISGFSLIPLCTWAAGMFAYKQIWDRYFPSMLKTSITTFYNSLCVAKSKYGCDSW